MRRVMSMSGFVVCTWILAGACIGNRPRPCAQHSECDQGFCSTRGFCQQECARSEDCPCGSYCASGCGLCIRIDNRGPGTCYAVESGLGVQEVLGVCAASLVEDVLPLEDGGVCTPRQIDPLTCAAAAPAEPPIEESDAAPPPTPEDAEPAAPMPDSSPGADPDSGADGGAG